MPSQLVQPRVGGCVVRLAGIAGHARQARKEHEQVQIEVDTRLVEVPGTADLGREYPFEPFRGLVVQSRVGQHARAMNDAGQLAVLVANALEKRSDLGGVAHVGAFDDDRGPMPFQRFDFPGRILARSAATAQHDGPRSASRQMPGNL